jgi:hypothetical protein
MSAPKTVLCGEMIVIIEVEAIATESINIIMTSDSSAEMTL